MTRTRLKWWQKMTKKYCSDAFAATHETMEAQRFKIVEDNGRLGEVVDFDDLARLRQWMRDSAPTATHI